jgi:hypothetical protein
VKKSKKSEGAAVMAATPIAGVIAGVVQGTASSLLARRTKVNGKMRGSIGMGCTIRVAGPDLIESLRSGHEILLDLGSPGQEFILQVKEAEKDGIIEFRPFIVLSEADIEIKTSAPDDEFNDSLEVDFEDKDGKEFGFLCSTEQARVLAAIFADFVAARDAWANLKKTRSAAANLRG